VGSTTAANIAEWMMEAQQKSIAARAGVGFGTEVPKPFVEVLDAQIKSGGLAGSELRWHARVVVPIGQVASQQPGGDPLYSLSNKNGAAGQSVVGSGGALPPRKVSGKAILRSGVVVFVLVDAPLERCDRTSAGGMTGTQFYDGIAESLQLSPGNL